MWRADASITAGVYNTQPQSAVRTVSAELWDSTGCGGKYTAGRRPVRLVYQEAFRSVGKALAREYVVKQPTRAEKDALVVSARRRHH